MERVGRDINFFMRHLRVFGFERTKEAYETSGDSYVRATKGQEVAGKVFHSHFGSKPSYIIEYQILTDSRAVIITGLDTHENFPFQKKLLDSTLFIDAIQASQAKAEKLHSKKLYYHDAYNDYKTACTAAKVPVMVPYKEEEEDNDSHLSKRQKLLSIR